MIDPLKLLPINRTVQAVLSFILSLMIGLTSAAAEPLNACSADHDNVIDFTLPLGHTLETIPAEYEKSQKTVTVAEARGEFIMTPPEYEWVDGVIVGAWVKKLNLNGHASTVTETIIVRDAQTQYFTYPLNAESARAKGSVNIIECVTPPIEITVSPVSYTHLTLPTILRV